MRELERLIGDFIAEQAKELPVRATSMGIDGHDDRLADMSADAIGRRERWLDDWRIRFDSMKGLDLDEGIDRDVITSTLRSSLLLLGWGQWRRNPAAYINQGLEGVFSLFLHRLRPDNELVRDAAARLRQIPEVLNAAKRNLDASIAAPVFIERGIDACGAAIGYCRTMVPAEVSEDLRPALAEAGEIAAAAYEDFASFLTAFKQQARGDYAIGAQMYSDMLCSAELLNFGVRELRERGRMEFEALSEEMARRARDLGHTDEWVKVIETLNSEHPATPEEMRTVYAEWTQRARSFLIDRGLVTLPEGEVCLVEPSPPFQRPVMAVASYQSAPPFKPSMTGYFFVPYPPDGEPAERIARRMTANSYAIIPTVSVHEAYPGHHWHLTMMNTHARQARKVFGSSYFSEGWALYTEMMMLDEGFYDDPRHEFMVMAARIFRAARIVVDTSLHIGDMSVEEAEHFMTSKCGLPEPTARAEVGRYCTWPTQASSYLTGCLEVERMRRRWFAEGRGDLRAFHDRITSSGSLPLALAERALFSSS